MNQIKVDSDRSNFSTLNYKRFYNYVIRLAKRLAKLEKKVSGSTQANNVTDFEFDDSDNKLYISFADGSKKDADLSSLAKTSFTEITPVDVNGFGGQTKFTYPNELTALVPPQLTTIIGDDGINFSVQIIGYTTTSVEFVTFDESGRLYNGTGSVIISII